MCIRDRIGTVYIIKIIIGEETAAGNTHQHSKLSYQLYKMYPGAHTKTITDICVYPNNKVSNVIFATSGMDGCVNIWDIQECWTPLYTFDMMNKPVYSLAWDKGGKYLFLAGEGPTTSVKYLLFDNVKKDENEYAEDLVDLRYLLTRESSTKVCAGIYSPYVFISDIDGSVIAANGEDIRRETAVRQKKGKKSEIRHVCTISYDPDEELYKVDRNDRELKLEGSKNTTDKQVPHHFVNSLSLEANPNNLKSLEPNNNFDTFLVVGNNGCLLYTSPSPRDQA
eukprot:TRINITY_DN27850_c0_g2_i1.p1 TRINITY_DN27850_c0_g2~~TRINITY_DN27850_c0_g2_i1.p1  ORF type:complete len:308 (-),score=47.68 TRINITY_DN27850_c0_g2_i1:57-899(-)